MDNKDKYKLDRDVKENIELLLYAYPSLMEFVEDHDELIKDIKLNGYRPDSKDIIGNEGHGSAKNSTEFEKLESAKDRAWRTYQRITQIQSILDKLKKQEIAKYDSTSYYQIIELYYFKEMSLEKIAYKIGLSICPVSLQKERLLYRFALMFYGVDIMKERKNVRCNCNYRKINKDHCWVRERKRS